MFGRGTSLSLSLSLVARTFWHAFGLNLKGFFTRFIVVLTHLFAYKRYFLGHCAFLKFLNALFLGFLRLSLRAVFAKTAWQSINLALFLLFGLPRSLCSLAMTADFVILSLLQKGEKSKGLKAHLLFLDTSLTLSMTNSGFCLKIMDIFTQILKQKITKFISYTHILKHKCKFFTQNSRHFINSTHFINLTQISSPTQGFFISLPQVFAQCKLIKNFLQGGHCV